MNFATLLLFIGGSVLTVGDIFMKEWVNAQMKVFYLLGLLMYLIGLNFLAQSYRYKNIAVASVIFVIFNVVTLSLVSWLYYKESLSGMQIAGITVGILSIVMLELS